MDSLQLGGSLVAFVLATTALPAQYWSQVWPFPSNPVPTARSEAGMAHDVARGQTLLFGGYDGTSTPLGDFWAFDGRGWTQLSGPVPTGRWGHGMVYDSQRERVVLFGGLRPGPGNPLPTTVPLQDTWEYDGSTWTQLAFTTRPSPRSHFGFAYDPIRGQTVLFGGAGANNSYLQDTWEWNGVAWVQRNPATRPSIRRAPAMTFHRDQVLLFGGGALGTQFGDTWTYNGTNWTQRFPATSPPSRWAATLVGDPQCGDAVLFGGATFNYQSIFQDTWSWNGTTWTNQPTFWPAPLHGSAYAFGAVERCCYELTGRPLFFGGRSASGFEDELYQWENGSACDRDMTTLSRAVVGQSAQYRYRHPSAIAGRLYFELWTLRNPNAFVLQMPGIVSMGLTRVDLFNVLAQTFGILGSSGQQDSLVFPVPNHPSVLGFTYDVQSVDFDTAYGTLYWAQNDVEESVVGVPVAAFTASPTSGTAPLLVQFSNTSSHTWSYQWDFDNDGVFDSNSVNPSFTYATPGTYTVRLVATGPGGSNTLTQSNLIQVAPVPSFTATPTLGMAPLTVQFTDTTPPPVASWQWDFQNDGVIDSTLQNPSFVFTAGGSYSVRLVVGTVIGPRTVIRNGMITVTPPFSGSLNPALNMVAIAPGTFQMGSNAATGSPYFSSALERPVHSVTVTQPFWIGRYEVTQANYQALIGSNPSHFRGSSYPNATSRPVEQVTWIDAVAYCDALTVQEAAANRLPWGYEYRLPTEAEWEYCCRAGTTTEFHYGPTLACGQANFSFSFHSNTSCGTNQTTVVGNHAPNAWGLYDMHGNVKEWCLDSIGNYPAGAVSDPYMTGGTFMVVRGGDWLWNSAECRSAYRGTQIQTQQYDNIGFRIVCAPLQP